MIYIYIAMNTVRFQYKSVVLITLVAFWMLGVNGYLRQNNPITSEKSDVMIDAGDHGLTMVDLVNQLRDIHAAHFTDLKIGIGIILIFLLLGDLWFGYRKCRAFDARRIDRRAGSQMVRRYDARPQLPQQTAPLATA